MKPEKLFNLLATAIILKDPLEDDNEIRYLITHRSNNETTFPGKWTVPGGHLDMKDITEFPKETEHYWYNVMEKALRREVKEECNLDIKNIWYLTSLVRVKDDGTGSMVLSFVAEQAGGEVKLDGDMQGYKWVTYEEAKSYDLLDGILEEFYMIEKKKLGEQDVEWMRIPGEALNVK